ncbi:MAG TPA: hypothetical protein VLC79_02125 [Cellvibrio sp.]|nr:hypothetical protein [Cellvibrio sp.]
MNRPESNRPVPLWLTLLILPILGLAIYLQFNNAPVQDLPAAITEAPVATATTSTRPTEARSQLPTQSPSPTANAPSTKDSITTPASAEAIESARAAVHRVENGVYERATAMFEQEPVDVEWASSYEQSLREMFSMHQGLQRVSVNSISCHTSMCRIEVFTPRDADADFFTAMFYDALGSFREGALKAEAAIARRMEQGMTSVYVARKDHTLRFY